VTFRCYIEYVFPILSKISLEFRVVIKILIKMKKTMLTLGFAFSCIANLAFGQEIPKSQVLSVLTNIFQQSYPKAHDVEWELKGETYIVDFETGVPSKDHEIWYDKSGKVIRQKQEIAKGELPKVITSKIKTDFKGYRTSDIDKITKAGKTIYKVELETFNKEWRITFDNKGKILSKIAD
jgi:uncharacterized membrane protein YkoI